MEVGQQHSTVLRVFCLSVCLSLWEGDGRGDRIGVELRLSSRSLLHSPCADFRRRKPRWKVPRSRHNPRRHPLGAHVLLALTKAVERAAHGLVGSGVCVRGSSRGAMMNVGRW